MKLREGYAFVMLGEELPTCSICGREFEIEEELFLTANDEEVCVKCADKIQDED